MHMSKSIAVASLSLLAACASPERNWSKSDVPRSQTDADLAQCQFQAKAATASYQSTPSKPGEAARVGAAVGDGIVIAEKQIELTNDCMRAKGYVSR